jgi:hypothetical protein
MTKRNSDIHSLRKAIDQVAQIGFTLGWFVGMATSAAIAIAVYVWSR